MKNLNFSPQSGKLTHSKLITQRHCDYLKFFCLSRLSLKFIILFLIFITSRNELLPQCHFYPDFNPNNHFTILAGCKSITIQVTPWWNDTPTEGDVIISIIRVGRPFSVIDQGAFTRQDIDQNGIFQSHQFSHRFSFGEFDIWEPESLVLTDMYGTQALIRYYFKCVNESNYTLLKSINYNGTNGPVLNGSIENYINTFDLLNATNSYTNTQGFTVNGNLDIDVPDYCFKGQNGTSNGLKHIRMLPGSKITVKSGNFLKIKDNYIIACDGQRWNSLVVESGATLVLENTSLDNGHFEVEAKMGSTIIAKGSVFKDGAVGIRAEDGAMIFVDNSDFYFSGSFNSFYSGEPFILGNRTYAGIFASNSLIKVTNGSTFESMLNGVHGVNSNITVENSILSHISDFGTNNWSQGNALVHNGKGIHSASTTGNNVIVENSNFHDVMCGIYTRGVNANIKTNEMSDVLTGMQFDHSPGRNFDIKGNTISAEARGINFSWTGEVQSAVINEANNIQITGANGIGLDMVHTRGPVKLVYQNNILIGAGSKGINHTDSENSWIYNNSIFANGSGSQPNTGIYLGGGNTTLTACNLLSSSMNCHNQGIYVGESPDNAVIKNTAAGWLYDMQYFGTSSGTVFAANQMGNANHGLILGFPQGSYSNPGLSARIGEQEHRGNRWIGIHYKGADHYGPQIDRSRSKFTVNAQDPQNSDYKPNNFQQLVTLQFFEHNLADAYDVNCMLGIGSGSNHPWPRVFPQPEDEWIAIGNYDNNLDWGARIWSDRRQLYAQILRSGGPSGLPELYSEFYQDQSQTSVGIFETLERGLKQAYESIAESQSSINTLLGQGDSLNFVIQDFMLDLSVSDDPATRSSVMSQIEILKTSLASINNEIQSLYQPSQFELQQTLTTLEQLNQSVNVTEDYEIYQKQINQMMLQKMIGGEWSFSESEINLIEYIAALCPSYGGPAVYRARGLAGLWSLESYNDENICVQMASERSKNSSQIYENGILASPNPMYDRITIFAPEMTQIEIYDLHGKMIYNIRFNSISNNLDLSTETWLPGIYIARIYTKDLKQHSIRLIK